MILSKVYEDAEHKLKRNEITLGEFARLVDIEVEKVVYCKDCKAYTTEAYQDGYGYCERHCSVIQADDFCSYGEREGE